VQITNKKITIQQLEFQEQEDQKKLYDEQRRQLKNQNRDLKAFIDGQKKQILDRDKTIGEKERKIYELKKKSQELEKFKFVLDHKIKELKRDIGPRELEIAQMKEDTNKMDQKLKKFNAINNTLGMVVDELDSAQEAMKAQIMNQRAHLSSQVVKIRSFKNDVYKTIQFILYYEQLRDETMQLYTKYVTKDIKKIEVDEDIEAEYKSQKKYLEKSVVMLKKNLQKDNDIHKSDNIRIMRDNVALIQEITKLRKQIKEIRITQKGSSDKGVQPEREEVEQSQLNELSELNQDSLSDKKALLDACAERLARAHEAMDGLREENEGLQAQLGLQL